MHESGIAMLCCCPFFSLEAKFEWRWWTGLSLTLERRQRTNDRPMASNWLDNTFRANFHSRWRKITRQLFYHFFLFFFYQLIDHDNWARKTKKKNQPGDM
jgi:hypothetical protein